MAALHTTLALSHPSSSNRHKPHLFPSGILTSRLTPLHQSSSYSSSSFTTLQPRVGAHNRSPTKPLTTKRMVMVAAKVKPSIQFIQGRDEQTVPDVRLTRSKEGTNGVATFTFDQPSVFDSSKEVGDITGLYMIDEEGVLRSVDVNAKFVNGKPAGIEAKYIMRSPGEWDRFMRFMERYAEANGLSFIKK